MTGDSSAGETIRTPTTFHWGRYDVLSSGDRVVALEPHPGDPDPSPIGAGVPEVNHAPYRITRPMVRESWLRGDHGSERGRDRFVAVSWDRASDLAAGELARVRDEHGPAAIYGGSYGWGSAGRFHHPQSQIHRFLAMAGGYTASVNTYSFAAMEVVLPHVIGGGPTSLHERGPTWRKITEHAGLVVSFGGLAAKNTQMVPGGPSRHTQTSWQRAAAEAGVRFVNVSPVRDDAAADLGAQWLPLRPGTDTALMLALIHVLLTEDLADTDFANRCCSGFDRLRDYVLGRGDGTAKDPAWATGITGVPAGDIRDLARTIAAHRTVINLAWSIQRHDHGEQPYWAGIALAALSGSCGLPGGGPAGGLGIAEHGTRGHRRIAALPQPPGGAVARIPVARVADMLLDPGATIDYDGERITFPDIRLVYWAGGNPFHHHQDLGRLERAWRRPDTVIVHESWWNATATRADIVFPVATTLERDDFALGSADSTISAMHRAVPPPAEVRTDHAVFAGLAERLGFGERFTEGRSEWQWVRELYDRTRDRLRDEGVDLPGFDAFWNAGSAALPEKDMTPDGGSFAALRADPAAAPLATPSGRIELVSDTVAAFGYPDCPGMPMWLEPYERLGTEAAERHGLHLVSNQPKTRLHSQYDGGRVSRESKVGGREPVDLHPDDARARGIADGDTVRIHNDRGACLAGARLTDAVRPGVAVLATGAWYDPDADGLCRHGNPNVLTRDVGTSRLAQGPTSGTTLVEIEPAGPDVPDVRAFDPPEIVDDDTGHAPTTLPSGRPG
ncbi:biotin/methionine sulfoxide reductase [Prauserella sediminis]|uniref:Biotin/methionine sulfoxide reductase n=1 Tax=Prauserella sediminis TaxID=577680 RepID=A0A839Y128_9PSEU|nr:molybdopterin-dependent oxidoreductase [Prauserella sediminis]MBB3665645.1 biotin/methionine sulfoxide reductase [Prauserella sediminis]